MESIKRLTLAVIGIFAFILLISEAEGILLLLISKVVGAFLCFIFHKLWKAWNMCDDKFVKKIE